jgi:hypothetical protein
MAPNLSKNRAMLEGMGFATGNANTKYKSSYVLKI